MKKQIGTPVQLAQHILEMGKQNLVVFCHPEDFDAVCKIATDRIVMEAVSVVKGTLHTMPSEIVERETFILAEQTSMTTEVKLDTRNYFSHANIDWEAIKRLAPTFDPKWYAGGPRSAEQIALDRELDKTFERIAARNNEHQLAQEELQREEFGYHVFIPGTLAKRLREMELNNTKQDLQLLFDLAHLIVPQFKD